MRILLKCMPRTLALALLVGVVLCKDASAHTVSMSGGSYRDSREATRRSVDLELGLSFANRKGALDQTDVSLALRRDLIGRPTDGGTETTEYEAGTLRAFEIGVTQTWNALTESRFAFDGSDELDASSRRASLGLSRWLLDETIQLSTDIARSLAERPDTPVLVDRDYQDIDLPRDADATSADFGVRHLATRTTIVDYGIGYTAISDRSDLSRYSIAAKQFIPDLDGAVHGKGTRFLSHGEPPLTTTVGRLHGWEFKIDWLQTLWERAAAQLGYTYYREDEKTRALGDEYTQGSDIVAFGLRQGFGPEGRLRGEDRYVLRANAARYLTNENVRADVYEIGVGALF